MSQLVAPGALLLGAVVLRVAVSSRSAGVPVVSGHGVKRGFHGAAMPYRPGLPLLLAAGHAFRLLSPVFGTCILPRMGSGNFDFVGPSCAILRIHGPLAQWWSRGLIILWLSVRVRQGPPEKFQLRSEFRFWAGFVFSGFCPLVSHLAATNRPPCSPLAAPLAFFRIALVLLDAYQFARFRRRTQLTTVTAACDDGRA